jgi:DNA-binding LacI/PurR family transcriptional regulator
VVRGKFFSILCLKNRVSGYNNIRVLDRSKKYCRILKIMTNVTIKDVALRAGVSKSSASAVLNGGRRDMFRASTVEKVYEAARDLGYQAHAGARLLRQNKSRATLVGIATHAEILNWHTVSSLIVATHTELLECGYQPVLVIPEQMVPGKSFAPFPSPEMLAGIISIDMTMEHRVPDFYKVLATRLPVVALYPLEDRVVDCVTTDRQRGIEMMCEHLAELGHRKIAFAEAHYFSGDLKITAWKNACERLGADTGPDFFIPLSAEDHPMVRGEKAAQALIQMKEEGKDLPTALMCGSDEVALCAMRALTLAGWRVGQDISVTGFDGQLHAQYSIPSLTTVAQPVEQIACNAVARLSQLIGISREEKTWSPQYQLIAPRLIARESSAPIEVHQ